jgi:hypothetical protein
MRLSCSAYSRSSEAGTCGVLGLLVCCPRMQLVEQPAVCCALHADACWNCMEGCSFGWCLWQADYSFSVPHVLLRGATTSGTRPFSQQRMSNSGSHGAALCVDVHTCCAVNVGPTATFSSYILIAAWQADAAAAAVITHGGVVPARMGALGY